MLFYIFISRTNWFADKSILHTQWKYILVTVWVKQLQFSFLEGEIFFFFANALLNLGTVCVNIGLLTEVAFDVVSSPSLQ